MLHFFHFELFVPCESKSYVIFSEDHVVDDCILRKLNKTMIKEWTKLDKEDVHIWLPASQAIAAWKMRESYEISPAFKPLRRACEAAIEIFRHET